MYKPVYERLMIHDTTTKCNNQNITFISNDTLVIMAQHKAVINKVPDINGTELVSNTNPEHCQTTIELVDMNKNPIPGDLAKVNANIIQISSDLFDGKDYPMMIKAYT